MQIVFMILFVLAITIIDQVTKYLVVANIPLYTQIDVIPNFIGLNHAQNFGAAWSSFQGMTWLFILIFIVLTALIVWEYKKQSLHLTKFNWWCIAAIYGGGLGNMIDRVRLGYVVDMIETRFITFPIFNVADCFITCGCIALVVSLLFFNKDFWKEDDKQ